MYAWIDQKGDSMSELHDASDDARGVPSEAWIDLTANKPGQAARARELEIKQSAKGRGLWREFVARNAARSWRVGADGEQEVGRRLDKLPDGWCILHAVPVG